MGRKAHDTADQTFSLRNNNIVAGNAENSLRKNVSRSYQKDFYRLKHEVRVADRAIRVGLDEVGSVSVAVAGLAQGLQSTAWSTVPSIWSMPVGA